MNAMKDLLRTRDLGLPEIGRLLDLAAEFKRDPGIYGRPLDGETVVLYFAKPSTRTRLSFEAAVGHLGGLPAVVGPNELQLGRGETVEDTARVVSEYARAFVIRTSKDEDVERAAAAASIPVINALTDGNHPCQSLADLMTLRERFGTLTGRKLAYVGDGDTNVTTSLIEACARMGIEMAIASPPGYAPNIDIVRWSEANGGRLFVTTDPAEAVAGVDAIYTDVWLSMGDPEEQRAARMAAFRPYQVTAQLFELAKTDAVFMHCLPAHRGEEVEASVIDGPRSIVFQQAENRMHTELAVLYALIEGKLTVNASTPSAMAGRS